MTTLAPRYKDLDGAPEGVLTSGMELSTLLAQIGSNQTELVLNQNVVVTANTLIPATLNVRVVNGSTISIADGIVLNFTGTLQAGLYQVFKYTGSATGQVNLGPSVPMVYPEWFVPSVSASANLSLQYAYNAAFYQGSQIYISQSIWMSATLNCHTAAKEITIRGASTRVLLRYDGSGGVISLQNGNNCLLENFGIDTQVVPSDQLGIIVDGCYRVAINKVTMSTRGLLLTSTQIFAPYSYGGVYWSNFTEVKAAWIWLAPGYAGASTNENTFTNCQTVSFCPQTGSGLSLESINGVTFGSLSNTFVGCDFSYANATYTVYAITLDQYATSNTFIGTYIEPDAVHNVGSLGAILNYGVNTSFVGGYISGALAVYPANSENYAVYTMTGGTKLSEVNVYGVRLAPQNAVAGGNTVELASSHITGESAFTSTLNNQSVGYNGYGATNGIYFVTNLTDGSNAIFTTLPGGGVSILASNGSNWSTTYNASGKEGLGYIAPNNGPYLFSQLSASKSYRIFCFGGY